MASRLITFNEVCHNGACYDGVIEFYKENFEGLTAVPIDDVLEAGADAKYLQLDGYGDGYGNGYGYGDGNGNGNGYGYGNGDGDGYGDGGGDGDGHGDGDGNGDGYGYREGDGDHDGGVSPKQ